MSKFKSSRGPILANSLQFLSKFETFKAFLLLWRFRFNWGTKKIHFYNWDKIQARYPIQKMAGVEQKGVQSFMQGLRSKSIPAVIGLAIGTIVGYYIRHKKGQAEREALEALEKERVEHLEVIKELREANETLKGFNKTLIQNQEQEANEAPPEFERGLFVRNRPDPYEIYKAVEEIIYEERKSQIEDNLIFHEIRDQDPEMPMQIPEIKALFAELL